MVMLVRADDEKAGQTWAPPPGEHQWDSKDLTGLIPESYFCVDCGFNTAPGMFNRVETEKAIAALGPAWGKGVGVNKTVGPDAEVYQVRESIWRKAGMEPWGGCLCIGCLEKRLGRRLKPKDFLRDHPFNSLPGTPRLRD